MKFLLKLALAGSLVMSTTAAFAQTVKIGLLAPFSGPFAVWGTQFKQSVEAFQKIHGDSIKGSKIEIIYRDNAGDPARTEIPSTSSRSAWRCTPPAAAAPP